MEIILKTRENDSDGARIVYYTEVPHSALDRYILTLSPEHCYREFDKTIVMTYLPEAAAWIISE